ncbi:hypothetical protein HXX76_005331 [Chlamydomonas incerta]|uniref:Uncharacterized protein n=1 Tax=Chlamydomonas incerta TaxID=51695 RepID=A0A835W487_CHLIN|nr:hypothetical protein HXX76_005331 [Chlamydomonas incerta]|eukprot:KAG2438790.1 hypothetical protein HXX76_005331 [Chlamydomonas incerta]
MGVAVNPRLARPAGDECVWLCVAWAEVRAAEEGPLRWNWSPRLGLAAGWARYWRLKPRVDPYVRTRLVVIGSQEYYADYGLADQEEESEGEGSDAE